MISIVKVSISKAEENAVLRVLRSGVLAQGKEVEQFEKEFAKYIGTKYAVAVSNGTTALHLAFLALGIGHGDEVITTPLSFIASTNSILYVGAKPVFVDVLKDGNIDTSEIEKKITSRTKAILPVHLYGNPVDLDQLLCIAKKYNLKIVEDACQAHGAEFNGRKVGSFGDAACFSFYATKNMTTGEGGMITTNNSEEAIKMKMLRSHGAKVKYRHEFLGYNFRMTEMQAAIGRIQLKRLNVNNKKRIENALRLRNHLRGIRGISVPQAEKNKKAVFHQFTITITDEFPISRNNLMNILRERGIESSVHYPIPIHRQKSIKDLGYFDYLPKTDELSERILSLPTHPGLSKKDIDFIGKVLNEYK